jgi:flavin-dependent dehydrogenase
LIDGLITPRRTILDPMIADAAASAGAEVRYSTSFRELLRDPAGRVRGAVIAGPDGAPQEVTAGIVVGADGMRSTVAHRVGAEEIRRSRHVAAHVYSYLDGLPDTGTHLYFREGLGLGLMPTNGGLHCAVVSMPRDRFMSDRRTATSPDGLRALLSESAPELAGEFARVRLAERPVGFAGEHGYIRRSHGPGWALVGDAAYFKDPVTAHGITAALRDAELLANAILQGNDAALARYQATRDAIAAELFAVTDEIAGFDWSLQQIKDLHTRLNTALKREQAWMALTFAGHAAAA